MKKSLFFAKFVVYFLWLLLSFAVNGIGSRRLGLSCHPYLILRLTGCGMLLLVDGGNNEDTAIRFGRRLKSSRMGGKCLCHDSSDRPKMV